MKKILLILFFTTILLTGCNVLSNINKPVSGLDQINTEDYFNEQYKVGLKNPLKWEKIENINGVLVVFLSEDNNPKLPEKEHKKQKETIETITPVASDLRENVSLVIIEIEEDVDFREYTEKSVEEIKNVLFNFKLLNRKWLNISGFDGYQVSYEFSQDEKNKLRGFQRFIKKENVIYVLTFTDLVADFDKHFKQANQIMDSIYFK